METRTARTAACLVAAAAGTVLLVVNALAVLEGKRPFEVAARGYRYWEDVRSAAAAVRGTQPPGAAPRMPARADPFTHAVAAEAERRGIGPARFWRTVPFDALPLPANGRLTPLEDVGRARLLSFFFRPIDGVAPWLLLWVPALLAFPAFAALAGAWRAADRPVTAVALPLMLGASAFFADAVFLAYSPIGFYLVALVVLAAFAAWAASDQARHHRRRQLIAAAAAGALLAVCAACRSGTVMLLLGFIAAGAVLAARRPPGARTAALALVALLVVPPVVFRPSESHALWIGVWQGLGDFDREYGHSWLDEDAQAFLAHRGVKLRSPEAEPTMRRVVLDEIRADPAWYAGILARRVRAVVLQDKLSPWRAETPLSPAFGPGEGALPSYYALARHADTFALGRRTLEIPTWMLWAPLAALIVFAAVGLRRGQSKELARDALALGPVALGAMAVPVGISTAGALETQAFVIVHFTAAALLADAGRRAARRSAGPPSARS